MACLEMPIDDYLQGHKFILTHLLNIVWHAVT